MNLKSAELYHNYDKFKKQDPYCVVIYGDLAWKSSIHNNGGLFPIWNEYYFLKPKLNTKVKDITIRIWDKDIIKSDDYIGKVTIEIENIYKHSSYVGPFEIIKKGKTAGYLNMTFETVMKFENPLNFGQNPVGGKDLNVAKVNIFKDQLLYGKQEKCKNFQKRIVKWIRSQGHYFG